MAAAPASDREPSSAPGGTTVTSEQESRDRLADLTAQATGKYAIKDYNAAAELYAHATELQAEINGEMSVENADLLYFYGKCLYRVAVSNSDVLGSKVAGEKSPEGPRKPKKGKPNGVSTVESSSVADDRVAEEVVAHIAADKDGSKQDTAEERETENTPFFQFTGDENFVDSEQEGEDAEGEVGGEEEQDEDDFSNAFEVLDLARVLLIRKLEGLHDSGKGKATTKDEPSDVKQIKERLADTYDLQAEISLEGERFPNAVVDLKSALALKQELFPQESSVIAECHYKLSLALEFSSVTQHKDENGNISDGGNEAVVDEAMREEAAKEMEAAIESCKLRIQKEEASLTSGATGVNEECEAPSQKMTTKEDIADVKEMVADMEQRLIDLRQPPVSLADPTSTGAPTGSNPLSGILGQILGEFPAEQKARLDEASKSAKDVSGLVRRKKVARPPSREDNSKSDAGDAGLAKPSVNGNGKRKVVEFVDEVVELGTEKRARVEDADDDG